VRLFLALELPPELREVLATERARLQQSLRGWRWARPESIHLTLRFLGEVDPELDRRSRETWRAVAARSRPFRIRLGGAGRFPPRGAPRILWLGTEEVEPGDALAELAEAVERAARELGWPEERRPFRPHLTLARAERGGRPDPPREDRPAAGEGSVVREVALVQSHLHPSGARYTALESYPLSVERGRALPAGRGETD
jgi:2'-5' RNA ligase